MPGFRPEHFEFYRLIGLYHRHFTPDRVMVLPYEAMLADRDAFGLAVGGDEIFDSSPHQDVELISGWVALGPNDFAGHEDAHFRLLGEIQDCVFG